MENLRLPFEFKTLRYSGVWLGFSGDRTEFRKEIETFLRQKSSDSLGRLEVREDGPHWIGKKQIYLSYSHTKDLGVLVYSQEAIGVDLENTERELKKSLDIVERFFHPDEVSTLKALDPSSLTPAFINLWVKKEAFGKYTRLGLKHSIHEKIEAQIQLHFEAVPKTPPSYAAFCVLSSASGADSEDLP